MDRIQEILEKNIKITGFFKELSEELMGLAQDLIPYKAKEEQYQKRYFSRLENAYGKAIKTNSWVRFWQTCTWLTYPSKEDLEYLPYVSDFELANAHLVLCYSLRAFQDENLESSEECKKLYEFYKLTKPEINKRKSMPQLPEKDAFIDYQKHSKAYQKEKNKWSIARKTGKPCPYCNSENVVSDGHSWRCKDCKKYWRKH